MRWLHVITACTRPENLQALFHSIYDYVPNVDWCVDWHLLHLDDEHVGGQHLKNLLLDQTGEGWVYVLDDDTIMHPKLLLRSAEVLDAHPACDAIFFARIENDRVIEPEVRVGGIDIGQVMVHRTLVGDTRIPELYEGDGWFLQNLVHEAKEAVYLSEPLSFYNRLR